MFGYFHHKSIRNLVVSFGTLFNNINIKRFDAGGAETKNLRIPLSYTTRERFIARLQEGGSIANETNEIVAITLPRMSFEITDFQYDGARKRQTIQRFVNNNLPDQFAYNEVPYDITFNLNIYVKYMEDALQIVEQILPYFTPEFTITINPTEMYQKVDIPIVFSGISHTDSYEGDYDERRVITFTLSFVAKSYIYGKVQSAPMIREAFARLFLQGPEGSTGGAVTGIEASVTGPSGASSGMMNYEPQVILRQWGSEPGDINIYGEKIDG